MQRIKQQASSRETLIPNLHTSTKIDVPSVVTVHLEGFQCPAKKFQCKACHKFGHFTGLCYQKNQQKQAPYKSRKPKAHQLKAGALYVQDHSISGQSEDSSSDGSFCLQLKIQHIQADVKHIPTPAWKHITIVNLYLRARLDTCADVNIMPASVYRLMFKDPIMKKLAQSKSEIGMYATDTVKMVGSCRLFLVHPDSKKLVDVTFIVAINDGSVLLSCKATLALELIQPRSRLDYLPLELAWSQAPLTIQRKPSCLRYQFIHPSKKCPLKAKCKKWPLKTQATTIAKEPGVNKLITSKDQIWTNYPDVFEGIGKFPGPPYSIQLDPSIPPKQTPCCPVSIHLKQSFKQEIDMWGYKMGVGI